MSGLSVANALDDSRARLSALLAAGEVFVLTGAGASTASGIPDYRDEAGEWKHKRPVQFRDFVGSEHTRRRYWARSTVGWELFGRAKPNPAHSALAELEELGLCGALVTQNVDGLHQRAGSRNVIDLHGRLDRVVCLGCGTPRTRNDLQRELLEQNPGFEPKWSALAPDGDSDLAPADYENFRVVDCAECGGLLKPDVVFFGESVPKERVLAANEALGRARSLLIVGSSLMVFSGYRFAREAERRGLPIAIVNRGKTRADPSALLKVEGDAGVVLAETVQRLRGDRS